MSADLLREAAAAMRANVEAYPETHSRDGDFLLAVAVWLEACSAVLAVSPHATKAHALAVARAYLEMS